MVERSLRLFGQYAESYKRFGPASIKIEGRAETRKLGRLIGKLILRRTAFKPSYPTSETGAFEAGLPLLRFELLDIFLVCRGHGLFSAPQKRIGLNSSDHRFAAVLRIYLNRVID